MTPPRRWFDRTFELGLGVDAAPELLERLRRTPERLATAVRGLPVEVLIRRPEGKWSIQENAGHLFDLEALWDQRLDDYDADATQLEPADLENRKTHEAAHNDRPISNILADFRAARGRIVDRIARMSPAELARTARRPTVATTDVGRGPLFLRGRARRPSPAHHRRDARCGIRDTGCVIRRTKTFRSLSTGRSPRRSKRIRDP